MAKSEKINFEDAMVKLEDIVSKLECGNLALDESIKEFEEAVKLIRFCEEKISSAKQKVRILTEGSDGSVTDKPFTAVDTDET